jgi:hypothetical protein
MTLDDDTREVTAFNSWGALLDRVKAGYVPTIDPREGSAAKRLRRALAQQGLRVHPTVLVKFAGLTDTQVGYIEDYLTSQRDSSNERERRVLERDAHVGRTVATIPLEAAWGLLNYLESYMPDAIDNAGSGYAKTDEEIEFAERAVERSYLTMISKVAKELGPYSLDENFVIKRYYRKRPSSRKRRR